MTNARKTEQIIADEDRPAVAALTAERFGPLAQRNPGAAGDRVRAIAAIHALAEFFVQHPDVPVPTSVTAYVYTADDAETRRLAEMLGEGAYGASATQFDHTIAEHVGSLVWAQVVVSARQPDRPL